MYPSFTLTPNTDYRFAFEVLRSNPSNHLVPFLSLIQLAVRRSQFPILSNACSFRFTPYHTVVFIDLTCLCVWVCCCWIEMARHRRNAIHKHRKLSECEIIAWNCCFAAVYDLPCSRSLIFQYRKPTTNCGKNNNWKRSYNEYNNNNKTKKRTMPRE